MSRGDAAHAAQHKQGITSTKEPPVPQTVERRIMALDERVASLEAKVVELSNSLPKSVYQGEVSKA
jgi:hypothetical protein